MYTYISLYIYIYKTSPNFWWQIHHSNSSSTWKVLQIRPIALPIRSFSIVTRPYLNSTRTGKLFQIPDVPLFPHRVTTCHHLTLPLAPPCSCEADNLAVQVFGSGCNSLQSSLFPTSAVAMQDISEIHSHIQLIEVIIMILGFVHIASFDMIVLSIDYRSPRSMKMSAYLWKGVCVCVCARMYAFAYVHKTYIHNYICKVRLHFKVSKLAGTVWPSGLRRCVGSNPVCLHE